MKRPEWIFVGVLALVASWFVYNYFSQKNAFKEWDLVPSNAVLVYESESVIDTWNKLVTSEEWKTLEKVDEFVQMNKSLQLLDTLSGGNGQLAYVLNNDNVLISAHVTSQNSFGVMFYIPLKKNGHDAFLNLLINAQKELKFKKKQRVYQGQTIYELGSTNSKLSYIVYKNTLILSKEAFLVEDVVRNIQDGFNNNFRRTYPMLSGNPSFTSDEGNLYVNGKELPLFADSFLSIKSKSYGSTLLAAALFFDLAVNENGLLASGFAFEGKENSLISTFKDQQAVSFNLNNLIPENTAILEHFGSSSLPIWYEEWVRFNKSGKQKEQIDEQTGKTFMGFMGKEMALATLQSVNSENPDKIYIAELSDKEGMYNLLNKMAEGQLKETTDSLYIEGYSGYEIRLIDKRSVLEELFGSSFKGFGSSYYMLYGKYLVIANTAETLRNWIIDIEDDRTWGKSVQMNTFFKDMLTEANYTYVTNLEYSWNLIINGFNESIKNWVTQNSEQIKNFGLVAFQVSNLDNRYYANLNLNYHPRPVSVAENNVVDKATIQLVNPVAIKPKVVRNHTTGAWEILVQDSLNHLMLLGANDEVLWDDSLKAEARDEIYQLDYYKNNKLQYLIHSDSSIYLIDRNGDNVANYPIRFNYKINQVYLIDYDRSKRYRILVSDYFGNLRMYDQEGHILEGWSPNAFKTSLADDIFHIRVRGNDRIVVPLANGKVYLTNRRGESAKGFPLDLGMDITTQVFFEPGDRFDDSQFVTVSKDGLVGRFTMTGKMLSRNQLFKESSQSTFELVQESQGKDFIFIRNDLGRLAILTREGEVLFEKDYLATTDRTVQYYNFGADRKLFVVKNNSTVYLYNQNGKLLNTKSLTSDFPVSIVYFSNDNICQIYLAHSNTIEIKRINF